jgi:AAA domain, putative AbiEii toxin, Type IV TA system
MVKSSSTRPPTYWHDDEYPMRLKSLSYRENIDREDANPWELQEIFLDEHNLIVAKNATGKTRILNALHSLARLIQAPQIAINGIPQKITANREWSASFSDESGSNFEFFVAFRKGEVVQEKILIDGEAKLNREPSSAKIYSETTKWQTISPPNDQLILHVRRDKNEFPFLESLISWANGVRGLSFGNTSPNFIEIPGKPSQLMSLNAVPSALEQLSALQLQNVLNQLRDIGYILEDASTGLSEGLPPTAKIIFLKEQGIAHPLRQVDISQGMFRAFSLLTIIEFLRSSGGVGSILIDDFGEGLDFERTRKLAELIFSKNNESKIQIIATSNDSFLMNAVPLHDLTICYRSNHIVRGLNYSNSKEKFDSWKLLGLNNFDLFSSNFLQDQ